MQKKAASAKRVQKAAAVQGGKVKQSKPASLAKAKAGTASAPRMVRAKSTATAEPRRAKASVEQTAAVAKKVASKLAAHPEVRLALRALPVSAAPEAAHKVLRAKGQIVQETIEISDHRPVTQKIQKKVPTAVASVASSGAPVKAVMAEGSTAKLIQAAAEKAAAEKSQVDKIHVDKTEIEKAMVVSSKPQPIVKEMKGAAVKSAEVKAGETKPVEKPGAAAIKPVKPAAPKQGFKPMEYIVYPAHGVGQIVAVEEQEVAGFKLELFVISFIKDKMILKVPTPKSVSVGMRKLAGPEVVKRALGTLTGRARVKRTMWSRRAQEYEAKINSGDLVAIAEVVRDLYRSDAQPEQSYSERQLYEAALDRVVREIAVVEKLTETESLKLIDAQLQKGPRRGKGDDVEVDPVSVGEGEDGDIDEAA
ncbi:CarD family transcriptional regulator [Methylovirgula sp. HY1]|uniref:CarD family transcriptional regulator n=1 Tax=Methylovirgula sp. HY1 TaxID=2822761 RepID=UPI0021039870|nr:CarD family transcriptional regulator [Methylovirgula sp. HY1]